jgi:transglutaminase-like putative cysteine protease
VKGLDKAHFDMTVLNKGRQRFRDGILEIVREKLPERAAYAISYSDKTGAMRPFLQPEINIECDDRMIIEKAREIAGDAVDPIAIARRLMAWVYANIEKRPVMTVPSALEVLKTGVGDCNEHAALLTALLRASGIPARLCVGLVYTRGKFFYHAWSEAYMGVLPADASPVSPGKARASGESERGWISLDAILNQMPADPTHIKLAQGGLDRQVEIIGLIGKLQLEVIE